VVKLAAPTMARAQSMDLRERARSHPSSWARWDAIDDTRSAVTLDVAGTGIRVEVGVDDHGQIVAIGLRSSTGGVRR